jgi:hypothetical protein
MSHIIDFPTRISESGTAIDNIFIDHNRINSFVILSLINGLSDHDVQYFNLNNVFSPGKNAKLAYRTRVITKDAIATFLDTLSNETWENIYAHDDINKLFNSFLNTFLLIFESCFPLQTSTLKAKKNEWITKGIRVSCKWKESLYITSRKSNSLLLKKIYKQYCTILRRVIREAKKNVLQ